MTEPYDFAPQIAACLAHPDAPPPTLLDLVREVLAMPEACPLAKLVEIQRRIDADPLARRPIGLVYGGATKIKGYVFEAPKLPEIRGASALLDWVGEQGVNRIWRKYLPVAPPADTLHPAIIYAGGGSFLAFAPAELAPTLATAVEREYTTQTLTANSVAVAASFHLLELRYGRLYPDGRQGEPYWVERFLADCQDERKRAAVLEYYYPPEGTAAQDTGDEALRRRFFNRKTFGELVTVLATMFNRRRDERASHGEPRSLPQYAMMPWAEKCQSSDVRPAVLTARVGSDDRLLSEPSARKLAAGRAVKGVEIGGLASNLKPWTVPEDLEARSWERRWLDYLRGEEGARTPYAGDPRAGEAHPAKDLADIGAASTPGRYIGLIYADGNNIGRLMATLATPAAYHAVSRALSDVAQHAVFAALARHLRPVETWDEESGKQRPVHPFEILAIGGDDLFVIVPGNKAFDIALSIARNFERELTGRFEKLKQSAGLSVPTSQRIQMRYAGDDTTAREVREFLPLVGLSAGVLIAQENTPFFFLRDRVEELLKSAKKCARTSARLGFFGGAVDFMVMKSITMVSDDIAAFRKEALGDHKASRRRLTARPYTWAEFAGLLATVRALKQARAPRSQLYRLRRALDADQGDGVLVSTMEYLYTRARIGKPLNDILLKHIEHAWCYPSAGATGPIGMPPWLSWPRNQPDMKVSSGYETIWPDLLETYEFVETDGHSRLVPEAHAAEPPLAEA
jgi:CRISPR-associated protein Cmr2